MNCTLFNPDNYSAASATVLTGAAPCDRRATRQVALLDASGLTTVQLCRHHRRLVRRLAKQPGREIAIVSDKRLRKGNAQ